MHWPSVSLLGLALAAVVTLSAGPAAAHTFSLSVLNNSACRTADNIHAGTYVGYPDGANCFETGLADTNVAVLNDTGGDSESGSGSTVLTNDFAIDAAVAVDAFIANEEYQELRVSYSLTFTIDTDTPDDGWTLTLDHDALGLNALHGDGTLSAVGTQDDGHAHMSNVVLSGDTSATLSTNNAFNDNPSNTSQSSSQFSDSASGLTVASGTGDATVSVDIDFTLDAFSNDGCSGFICSSVSGGEEAAVLFGIDDASGLGDVNADEYSEWGRAVGPDGYNSTWTLAIDGVVCGNGMLEGQEECDDGNVVPEDGCSPQCLVEFCGDGVWQPGLGEQCDDGNMTSGDGCSDLCEFEGASEVPTSSATALLVLAALLAGIGIVLARPRLGGGSA